MRTYFPACGLLMLLSGLTLQAAEPANTQTHPGLVLEFISADGQILDSRVSRLAALYLPKGEPPTPFLAPGPFAAVWRGQLTIPLRDRYTFSFEGTGRVELTLNGQKVLDADTSDTATLTGKPVRLRKGVNDLAIRYEPPSKGDAVARILWSSLDFAPEPLPPTALTHGDPTPALNIAATLRRGRRVLADSRCIRCHSATPDLVGTAPMPELAMDAPQLLDAGPRFNSDWLAAWIEDPRSIRPDAAMPRLLHGPAAPAEARDIAAYLTTLRLGAVADDSPVPSDNQTVKTGGELYAALGCVGCHTLDAAPDTSRVPLKHVRAKYRPAALREYLLRPSQRYLHNPMPDFHLSAAEAGAITAFLLARTAAPPAPSPPGDAERGRALAESRGCANCHTLPLANRLASPPLHQISNWKRGCLASDGSRTGLAPDPGLAGSDRAAVAALAHTAFKSLSRDSLAEFAERQINRLRCAACHERDGAIDRWKMLEGEVAGLLPPAPPVNAGDPTMEQTRPSLTWAGEKLRPQWTQRQLTGQLAEKVRPWLRARMPAFAAIGDGFAPGLAMTHGCPPLDATLPPANPELAGIGGVLLTKDRGFGCVDCHAVGRQSAQAVFGVEGVNLMYTAERLRPAYFHRWMLNPPRIDPHSRMPRYADDRGLTLLTEYLDGDAHRQFGAIGSYLQAGRNIQPSR